MIEDLRAQYELPLVIIQRFQTLMERDTREARKLVKQLAEIAGVPTESAQAKGGATTRSDDAFQQVLEWFARNQNRPATKAEIVSGSGVNEHTVHTLLYKAQKDSFEGMPHPDGGKRRVYRLKAQNLPADADRSGVPGPFLVPSGDQT